MKTTAIIPCSDATWLNQTVKSLRGQTSTLDEILVIADGIEIGTIEGVNIVKNPTNLGKSRSINQAVQIAKNPAILCIDADTELAPDGFEIMSKYLIDEIKIVIPSINPKNKTTWIGKGRAELYERVNKSGQGFGLIGCCFLSSKEYLLAHPFSSDTLTEDQDYAEEMVNRADRIFHSFKANCFTTEPESLYNLVKQESRWSYGSFQVQRKHHRRAFLGYIVLWVGVAVAISEPLIGFAISRYLVPAFFFLAMGLMVSDEIGGVNEVLISMPTVLGQIRAAVLFLLRRKRKW